MADNPIKTADGKGEPSPATGDAPVKPARSLKRSVLGLERRALSLGTANAFDYVLQFLLPVVLARTLDVHSFGQYRLLWLAVGTTMALLLLGMPSSLYYFLPRSDARIKRLYINQVLLFLTAAALVAAFLLGPWNPWLPPSLQELSHPQYVVPAFVFMWVIASLIDILPTVEERVGWQAKVIIGLAALRAVSLSLAAILTGELGAVLLVLLGFVVVKLALLCRYISRHHGFRGPVLRLPSFRDQIRHAAPFGISGSLHSLRIQGDQWIAAALFSVQMYAAFSVAAILGPMVQLFRQSVNHVFLPSMSRFQADGDIVAMLRLNNRANLMVAMLVFPLLALAFTYAEEIVTIVYTDAYIDAAHAMRVYIVGMTAYVVEVTTLMLLLRQGAFALKVNAAMLALSILVSWLAATHFGLAAAAAGSVTAVYLDRFITLSRLARQTGIALRRLQEWKTLGVLLAFAILGGILSWSVVTHWAGESGSMVRLAFGGAILLLAYVAFLAVSGGKRRWLQGVMEARADSPPAATTPPAAPLVAGKGDQPV